MKIYIAGHRGMVGSSVHRLFIKEDNIEIITRSRNELDLTNQLSVRNFISQQKPDVVVVAAAKVGGILANHTYPYDFIVENLQMEVNIVDACLKADISKVVFLGSSCIYPKFAPQPLHEDSLLTDSLEPTNQWYAIAKIAGVKMVEAAKIQYGKQWVSLMPTNLYGVNDKFDLEKSHVLPAMMRKFHEAKLNGHSDVILWGSGAPYRDFLHVDDLATAVQYACESNLPETLYNVGFGSDISIKNVAMLIQRVVGHKGNILWDSSKPDGTPKKLMDSSKFLALGWSPKIDLEQGLESTYQWFLKNVEKGSLRI